ncbi:MAG: serine protease [Planctomycetales bacterium]|nr:serine protease [Planctomycetales bacterium]
MKRLMLITAMTLLFVGNGSNQNRIQAESNRSFADVIRPIQAKMAKIYGAGGIRGLEAYQSGFFISDQGHLLTSWSYVLDSDVVSVTTADGKRWEATLLGADPRLEIAVLKLPTETPDFFDLSQATTLRPGNRVLAFSNLYSIASGNEPNSVLHGVVAAVSKLQASKGTFQTPYAGQAYILDAMTNNAGATGGALTDRQGTLAGILGKELQNSQNSTWLNYAIPIQEVQLAVEDIMAGRMRPRSLANETKLPEQPVTLASLGLILIPDVLSRTPPFVDRIQPNSAADKADLQTDDLILYVDGRIVQSRKELIRELATIDILDPVRLTVMRQQQLIEVTLQVESE